MKLNTYTLKELLNIGGDYLESFLLRPFEYRLNGRTEDEAIADRMWGDLSEYAFQHDTGAVDSNIKYQDQVAHDLNLHGHTLNGIIELKTIPRLDQKAATTAIQNYFLKQRSKEETANFFVVYYADRQNEVLYPFGIYKRGFANSIEPLWGCDD